MSARIARIPGVLALIALGCAPANNGVKPDTSSANADEGAADDAPDDDDGPAETTGQTCEKTIVLMGYWPPTNEMLRPWSTNPAQNPGGWQGENWRGHGFDVYAFFPEFPPDGDPSNDEIGDPGSVGSPDFDLQVDYQATSADFWRIVDTHAPRLLITTSRGGQIGWEIEALEGGHGDDNPDGPAADWIADRYGEEFHPTEATVDPRTWTAISTYRRDQTLPSQLPMDAIVTATSALGLTTVEIDHGTSGNYLSGFLGLHGLYYSQTHDDNAAAGHIHVGVGLPVEDATALIEATLETVISAHPADSFDCQ